MLSRLKSTAKNSFIYGIGNLSTKLIGLILLPLYTHILPVGEFGMLAMLESSSQVLITIFGLNLYNAFLRWYWEKEYEQKRNSMFFTAIVFLIFVSGIMVVSLIGGSRILASSLLGSSQYYKLIRLMVITAGFEIIGVMPLTLMRIQERPLLFITANVLKFVVNLTLTVFFIVVLKHRIEGIYEAQIIGNIIFFLFLSRYIIKHIEARLDIKVLKEMLSFSMPLVMASVAGIFLTFTDRFTLKFINGLEQLGNYQYGYKIANAIKVIVLNSVSFALAPVIYKIIDEKGSKRFYSKILTYMGFGVMIIVMIVSFFSKEISMILANKKEYWSAFTLIPVLAMGLYFGSLKDIVFTGLNISKKTKISAVIITSVSVINVGLNVIFIYFFRSMGAAVATSLSQLIYLVLVWKYSQKYFYVPYEWKKIIKIFIVGSVLTAAAMYSNNLSFLPAILIKLMLLCIFPLVLYWWNFFEEIELVRLRGLYLKWRNPARWMANIKNRSNTDVSESEHSSTP
ncbi:MAG: oligosaccharide flippase family protein [Bacteroidales bacterium]|jgi:O-antigen/teichoic acid export membrane protein